MRQVEYTGFGWSVIEIPPNCIVVDRTYYDGIQRGLRPEIKKWLKALKSGGYYSVQSVRENTVLLGEKMYSITPTTISFSRKADAMLFVWQCL